MDKLELAKNATKFVVSQSTAFVTASVIKNNTSPANKLQQAELVIGAYVLGALIGEKAATYAERQFDAVVSWFDKTEQKETTK